MTFLAITLVKDLRRDVNKPGFYPHHVEVADHTQLVGVAAAKYKNTK